MSTSRINKWITASVTTAVLLLSNSAASARILPETIGIKTGICGNGLAPAQTLTLAYGTQAWVMEFGADVQFRATHLSGLQTTLYYYPMGKNISGLRLGFFTNVRYNFNAFMSKATIATEAFIQPESHVRMDELQLSTVESQLGFALRIYHTEWLSTYYGIGAGFYHTLGDKATYPLIHREMTHQQLVLNIGLSFNLHRSSSGKEQVREQY